MSHPGVPLSLRIRQYPPPTQTSCADGAARLAAARHDRHRAARDHEMEPRAIPRAAPHARALGLGRWRPAPGSLSHRAGASPLVVALPAAAGRSTDGFPSPPALPCPVGGLQSSASRRRGGTCGSTSAARSARARDAATPAAETASREKEGDPARREADKGEDRPGAKARGAPLGCCGCARANGTHMCVLLARCAAPRRAGGEGEADEYESAGEAARG